jgi:CRISPR-associated endonuclease/helicase Cas3
MTRHPFERFWGCATGRETRSSFPYQLRLATGAWPDLLKVPTGLGKTASVVLAWIYKRIHDDSETPRRLVYCLPMRTLVEQTAVNTLTWLQNIHAGGFDTGGRLPTRPHVLMGGDTDDDWIRAPERAAILIGVQDILLSRALMRGYGVARDRWPVDFALLHNDAMWVFDEVQLMAAGAPTSAQLEAFQRKIGTMGNCRSLWMSATLEPRWLDTVDLDASQLTLQGLEAADREQPIVRQRLGAPKTLARVEVEITSNTRTEKGLTHYAEALAGRIATKHRPGKTTLAIVNRVGRAQALYAALKGNAACNAIPLLLVHSRFRPVERRKLNKELITCPNDPGRIVVATQAIEAGLDLTSAVMFTEIAPWASLVQRFGRLNRGAEEEEAKAFWIDIETDGPEKDAAALALPYTAADLNTARSRIQQLGEVSPRILETFDLGLENSWQVLRRKDLYQLFDTDPDLTGFDVDVSPYVRAADDIDIRVFWRKVADIKAGPRGDEARRPHRDEICPIPIGQAKTWLETLDSRRRAFVWDWVDKRWTRLDRLWPGALVLADASLGGYDETRGFDATLGRPVIPLGYEDDASTPPEAFDDDPDTVKNRIVVLPNHLRHVRDEAAQLGKALNVPLMETRAVLTSGLWHDLGKAHDVFKARCGLAADAKPLAKTPDFNWRTKDPRNRRYFRHELASTLAWLRHGPQNEAHDLIAYLIAAHHGKVRMGLRSLPDERGPGGDSQRRFARGVWDGDRLPAICVNGLTIPDTELQLDVMEIGGGASGRSWAMRSLGLLEHYGPFRLVFLEALVPIADWRASETEQGNGYVEDGAGGA